MYVTLQYCNMYCTSHTVCTLVMPLGCVEVSIMHPLDLIKTRLQIQAAPAPGNLATGTTIQAAPAPGNLATGTYNLDTSSSGSRQLGNRYNPWIQAAPAPGNLATGTTWIQAAPAPGNLATGTTHGY